VSDGSAQAIVGHGGDGITPGGGAQRACSAARLHASGRKAAPYASVMISGPRTVAASMAAARSVLLASPGSCSGARSTPVGQGNGAPDTAARSPLSVQVPHEAGHSVFTSKELSASCPGGRLAQRSENRSGQASFLASHAQLSSGAGQPSSRQGTGDLSTHGTTSTTSLDMSLSHDPEGTGCHTQLARAAKESSLAPTRRASFGGV